MEEQYGFDRGYGSHVPVLAACMALAPKGHVLELGSGLFSTPLLHYLCASQKRQLVTCEENAEWLEKFRKYECSWHSLLHVPNWDKCDRIDIERWTIVFVDHSPANRRGIELNRLRGNSAYLVVHDTNSEWLEGHNLTGVLESFAYRKDFDTMPVTSIVSDFAPIDINV